MASRDFSSKPEILGKPTAGYILSHHTISKDVGWGKMMRFFWRSRSEIQARTTRGLTCYLSLAKMMECMSSIAVLALVLNQLGGIASDYYIVARVVCLTIRFEPKDLGRRRELDLLHLRRRWIHSLRLTDSPTGWRYDAKPDTPPKHWPR